MVWFEVQKMLGFCSIGCTDRKGNVLMRYAKQHGLWDRAPDWDLGNLGCYHSSAIASLPLCALDSLLAICLPQLLRAMYSTFLYTLRLTNSVMFHLSLCPIPSFLPLIQHMGWLSLLLQPPLGGNFPPSFLLPSVGGCASGPGRAGTGLTSPVRPVWLARATQVQS